MAAHQDLDERERELEVARRELEEARRQLEARGAGAAAAPDVDQRAALEADLTERRRSVEAELAEKRTTTERELDRRRAAVEAELIERRAAVEAELAEKRTTTERELDGDRIAAEAELTEKRATMQRELDRRRAATETELNDKRAALARELAEQRRAAGPQVTDRSAASDRHGPMATAAPSKGHDTADAGEPAEDPTRDRGQEPSAVQAAATDEAELVGDREPVEPGGTALPPPPPADAAEPSVTPTPVNQEPALFDVVQASRIESLSADARVDEPFDGAAPRSPRRFAKPTVIGATVAVLLVLALGWVLLTGDNESETEDELPLEEVLGHGGSASDSVDALFDAELGAGATAGDDAPGEDAPAADQQAAATSPTGAGQDAPAGEPAAEPTGTVDDLFDAEF